MAVSQAEQLKVFMAVGTHEGGYERLIMYVAEALVAVPATTVYAQYGPSSNVPKGIPGSPFMTVDEMTQWYSWADCVVAQASPGILVAAIENACIPVLVPRQCSLGEAVDDHQMEFAEYLAKAGRALCAYSSQDIIQHLITLYSMGAAGRMDLIGQYAASLVGRKEKFRREVHELLGPQLVRSFWNRSALRRRLPWLADTSTS